MSTAVVQRDRLSHKEANALRYKTLTEEDKHNRADVLERQLKLMFAIGNLEDEQDIDLPRFLPKCCGKKPFDDAPLDCGNRRQERDHRKQNEKQNMLFQESNPHNVALVKRQEWLLSFADIQMVLERLSGWMSAAGLLPSSGIDRSTFCQMLFELDMIDQDKLPYTWALQVFDLKARPMKLCVSDPDYVDPSQEGRLATVYFISKWDFISVLDILVRQRFGESSRESFLSRFRHVSDFLQKEWLKNVLEGKEAARNAQLRLAADTERRGFVRKVTVSGRESATSSGRGSATPGPCTNLIFPIAESQTWKHDRNILGMLKEPEVIEILQQFRFLFIAIFKSYASEKCENQCSMCCEDVLTFCYDFALVPKLASRHEVQRLYNMVICVEELAPVHLKQSTQNEEAPQRSGSFKSTRSGSPDANARSASGEKNSRRTSFSGLLETVNHARRMSMAVQQVQAAKSGQPKSPIMKISRFKAIAQAAAVTATDQEDEEEEQQQQPDPNTVRIFGVPALAETLLRLAFGYFLVFGNSVQSAMTSRAKVLWLLAFIRANLVQIREGSKPRQTAVGAFEGSRRGGLAKLLGCLSPENFDEPDEFTLQAEDENPIEHESLESTLSSRFKGKNAREAWAGAKTAMLPTISVLTSGLDHRMAGMGPGTLKLTPPPFKRDDFTLSNLLCGKLFKISIEVQDLTGEKTVDKKALRKKFKKATKQTKQIERRS